MAPAQGWHAKSWNDSHFCSCTVLLCVNILWFYKVPDFNKTHFDSRLLLCSNLAVFLFKCACFWQYIYKNWNVTELSMARAQGWHAKSWSIPHFCSCTVLFCVNILVVLTRFQIFIKHILVHAFSFVQISLFSCSSVLASAVPILKLERYRED